MKKHLLASTALLLGAVAFAAPAAADVDVRALVTFDKTVFVDEELVKVKLVFIVVAREFAGGSAAESITVINQRNDNTYNIDLDDRIDVPNGADLTARIDSSITGNTGVTQVNQDVGNGVNQINSLSVAISRNAFFTESLIAVDQRATDGFSRIDGNGPAGRDKQALINNSVNTNVGVTMVNQNTGHGNNQVNAADLALGNNTAVALSEADLGQWNQRNDTDELGATVKVANIVNSVNGNRGVTAVNQTNGNFNNQAFVLSLSGSRGTSTVGSAIPTAGFTN